MKNYRLEGLTLIVLVGGMALWGHAVKSPDTAPAKKLPANKGYLKADRVEGEEIARLLELPIYKWKVRFPAGTRHLVFWAEDWHKGATEPGIVGLFTVTAPPDAESASDNPPTLIVKLPDSHDGKFTASVGGSTVSAQVQNLVIDKAKGGISTGGSPSRAIFMNDDVVLAGTAQNRDGSFAPLTNNAEIARNDRAVLFKMKIWNGPSDAMPFWEDGRVVLKTFH
jgi:hypothetical protein